MFADSLLESQRANRWQRGWTTLASFALQACGLAMVITLPLLYPEVLPKLHLVSWGTPIGSPPGHRAGAGPPHPPPTPQTMVRTGVIVAPREVPRSFERGGDMPIADAEICPSCVLRSPGEFNAWAYVPPSLGDTPPVIPPPPPAPVVRQPPISRMMEGSLIHRVQPTYPAPARAARIQGPVVLRAIISKSGTIENLEVLSGHPLLVTAAIAAVSQWRYRPYHLNGEPVEVETQVTVTFILSGMY